MARLRLSDQSRFGSLHLAADQCCTLARAFQVARSRPSPRACRRSATNASLSADLLLTSARIRSPPPAASQNDPLVFIHVLIPGRGRGWQLRFCLGDDAVIYVGVEELVEDDWWL